MYNYELTFIYLFASKSVHFFATALDPLILHVTLTLDHVSVKRM